MAKTPILEHRRSLASLPSFWRVLIALGAMTTAVIAAPGEFDAGGGLQSSANYANHGSIGGIAPGISTAPPSYVSYGGFILAIAPQDTDLDGLPDDLGGPPLHNLDSDGTDDNDRDTVNNADELAAGTDPADPNSFPGTPVDYPGMQLQRGWQLIAFRVLPIFDPDTNRFLDADGEAIDADFWSWVGKRLVRPREIRLQTGYWIYAHNDVVLPGATRPQLTYTPLPLLHGWNLVGFNESLHVEDFAAEHHLTLNRALFFHNRHYRRVENRPAPNQNLLSFETGYWIHADKSTVLTNADD